MTLDQLSPGQTCIVTGLSGRNTVSRRLMDIGIYPGLSVTVVRNAPLNDPMEVESDGYFISLRHDEARFVEVTAP